MKNVVLIFAIGLLALAAAFLLLDFHLVTSSTGTNFWVASSGKANPPHPGEFSPNVTGLSVKGNRQISERLQAEVKGLIQGQPFVGEIRAIRLPLERLDIPVLSIAITAQKHFWTPFYAQSEYQVVVAYASNGDVSFQDQEVVHFQSGSDLAVRQFKATFSIQDESIGISSVPGYEHYLADKMAVLIHENLQKQLED